MPRVLVSDPLAEVGVAKLRATPGVEVDVKHGLKPEELLAIIGEYDALAVRSETKVTAAIIAAADRLKIIGRAGVGVDNIDVEAATKKGILVVNSPDGNTLAAAELTVGMLLALARQIPQADAGMKAGKWERKKFLGTEIFGKTVGILGLGRIGSAVAERLKGFGVELIAYNPFVPEEMTRRMGVEPVSLDDVLRRSDFITIHTPLSDETRSLLSTPQFALMKDGVRIVNCARGGIVDEAALAAAVKSGKVGGIAFDVFTQEPPASDNPLLDLPSNNILTPHLGASTEEAQTKVAVDVCEQIADVLQNRSARTAVNLPSISAADLARIAPFQTLAAKIGSLQMQLAMAAGEAGRRINAVEVIFSGDFAGLPTAPITRAVLKGLMEPLSTNTVNIVNAPSLAEARGIRVVESHSPATADHTCLLSVRAHLPGSDRTICGTVYDNEPHIVHIDGYHVDISPFGHMIVTQHSDRPGIIGNVGMLLGSNHINIAGMHVGRETSGGRAIMVVMVDEAIPAELLHLIRGFPGMEEAQMVTL